MSPNFGVPTFLIKIKVPKIPRAQNFGAPNFEKLKMGNLSHKALIKGQSSKMTTQSSTNKTDIGETIPRCPGEPFIGN